MIRVPVNCGPEAISSSWLGGPLYGSEPSRCFVNRERRDYVSKMVRFPVTWPQILSLLLDAVIVLFHPRRGSHRVWTLGNMRNIPESYLHHLPFSQGNQPPPPNYHMAPALLFRVLNKTDDHPRLVPKGRGFHLGGWNSQHKGPMVDSRLEYAGNMTEKAMPLSCSP